MPARRAAGQLEAAVLGVLQQASGALSPGEVREDVGGDLAYTTVVTILTRLHAKGVLSRHKTGRVYRYAPVADEPGLAARQMARVLDAEADREAVLARFVSSLSTGRGTAAQDAGRPGRGRRPVAMDPWRRAWS